MTTYVDSSAAARLFVAETGSAAVAAHLDRLAEDGEVIVSSRLLETELRRVAVRLGRPQEQPGGVLRRVTLVDATPSILRNAGLLPGVGLRSLDALHVATALAVAVSVFVTYDERQAEAAASSGIEVLAPA